MNITPAAKIVTETLTDGSKVFNVVQTVNLCQNVLKFACVSETHAQQLAALLDECAEIAVES